MKFEYILYGLSACSLLLGLVGFWLTITDDVNEADNDRRSVWYGTSWRPVEWREVRTCFITSAWLAIAGLAVHWVAS